MISILHLSDPHFGTEVSSVVSALRRVIREVAPDILVISGDITQRARRKQFSSACRFIESLGIRHTLVIPGNHDIPLYNLAARLWWPYRNYEYFLGPREPVLRYGEVTLVALDATSPWRHTRGALDPDAVRSRLQGVLAKEGPTRNSLLGVCIHQPLWTALVEDRCEMLINHNEISSVLAGFGVDLIFSGHVHVPYVSLTCDFLPAFSPCSIFSGAGTAVSRRTRPEGPNSFNTLHCSWGERNAAVHVVTYSYEGKIQEFLPRIEYSFRRSGHGWQKVVNGALNARNAPQF